VTVLFCQHRVPRVVKVREDVYLVLPVRNDQKKPEVVTTSSERRETAAFNCHGLYIYSIEPMNVVSLAVIGGISSMQICKPFSTHLSRDRAAIAFDFGQSHCLVVVDLLVRCDVLCCKGEIKICELEKVFRYDTYSNQKSGQTGTLCITNFKVSFVTLKLDESAQCVVGFSYHMPNFPY